MSSDEKEDQISEIRPIRSFTRDDIGSARVLTSITSPCGREVEVTGEVDEAMKYAIGNSGVVIDEATNKRLLRKIDLYLAPVMCFLYACQFMDKTTNSYASVMGLREDLNMVGDMYSWSGTAFYLGYLFFEFPASYLLQRYPVSKTVSVFIIIWGVLLCLHSVPQYAGFITLRTLLGMFESSVTPAFVIFTSQWYKKEEQFLRTTCWFAFNGFGVIMGGAIAHGLATSNYSIPSWKILFVVTGLMTIVMGFVVMLHIPDTPTQAWFLTEEEKVLVVERIRTNHQGFGNKHFKWKQFREALTDVTTWLFFFFAVAGNIPNGGLTNFSSILLNESFNFSRTDSLLMNMPTGAVEVVGCILLAYSATWIKHRMAIAIIATVISLMCACLLAFAEGNPTAQLAGYYLFFLYPMGMICSLSCFASNTAGHTKKVTTNAIYLIGYCVGNLIGPQTFIATQAPQYNGAKIAIVVNMVVCLILLCCIYFYYWNENKRRDARASEIDPPKMENLEFADLTDKENPFFRYSL